ncbi:MAG: imidazole glycerol phosphate synthase subunit HisH [Nisaea sp.]|jgi:glutamine amidotransferase|uniref:imidazole glycerol phosphate synthase subunit HisH n=1 Tax=Nisaea sp. TaxID=2024842 RepID=UPI001B186A77|nr:imidazole glycerol phosphate synthase subunit HisH [Nisaea sp.]MBO6562253.1 imidazole glycerol phosphate synthase subunit HisH [Nisaea sp.]
MSSPKVTVLDFGIGNLFSVCRAVEQCGADVELVDTCPRAEQVERLILPGVGAFAKCLEAMRRYGAVDLAREIAETGRPMLGICVGMQALFEIGEEFGEHPGIGLIPGRVQKLAPTPGENAFKLPHIGWAPLERPSPDRWEGTPLRSVSPGEYAYFVHSYHGIPVHSSAILATTHYGSTTVTAAVAHENVTGVQFHPERSGPVGLRILKQFIAG